MNLESSAQSILPRRSVLQGWTLLEFAQVGSTNLVAAQLDAWHAVRADTQTAGRGRFQRTWVSDVGGLWLSAVLPAGNRAQAQLLPLVAGLAVIDAIRVLGVRGARLRWPNDILVNDLKLAGLLVDSFRTDRAVVGIGVNIANAPAQVDPTLKATATRFADLVTPGPSVLQVAEAVLVALRAAVGQLHQTGWSSLSRRINEMWGEPRQVKIDLDGVEEIGWFCGVDEGGRLLLRDGHSRVQSFEPHQVRLLREVASS